MLHLTLTGASAGTTLCLQRVRTLGALVGVDRTAEADTFAHWTATPDSVIAGPDTCPDCRHAARCAWLDGGDCARCEAMGWRTDVGATGENLVEPSTSEQAGYVDVENLSPSR